MYDLIEVRKDDLFTNSKVIAEGTENQHKNVKELIEKYQNDIEDFGTFQERIGTAVLRHAALPD